MLKRTTEGTTLQGRIVRKAEIEEGIKGFHQELNCLGSLKPKGESLADLKMRIESLASNNSDRAKAELPGLKAQYKTTLHEVTTISTKEKHLRAGLAALEAELRDFNHTASIEEVMEYLGRLAVATQGVVSLKNTISEQQGILGADTTSALKPLHQKRYDLLAEAALGKDVAVDIKKLEAEIKEEEEIHAAGEEVKIGANRAIVGLNSKLAEAERFLQSTEGDKKRVIHHFLVGQAQQIGQDYLKAAREVQEAYSRLIGLDALIQRLGVGSKSFAPESQIRIPIFKLKAFDGLDSAARYSGAIFSSAGFIKDVAREGEAARLKDIGITM